MAEIGTHLDLEALARPLQSFDKLHHVRRMHIIIGGPVIEHQSPFEFVSVSHERTGVVAGFVFFGVFLCVVGGFTIFEGVKGWCALRAI